MLMVIGEYAEVGARGYRGWTARVDAAGAVVSNK